MGASSRIEILYLEDGHEKMNALISELRSLLCACMEPNENIVGHALEWIRPAGELWPEVGDSLRKGWRIVVMMNPRHLQERSDTPCWTIQLLPCVSQGMLQIR